MQGKHILRMAIITFYLLIIITVNISSASRYHSVDKLGQNMSDGLDQWLSGSNMRTFHPANIVLDSAVAWPLYMISVEFENGPNPSIVTDIPPFETKGLVSKKCSFNAIFSSVLKYKNIPSSAQILKTAPILQL